MICPWCGSPNTTSIEWHGPTGVVAPDGGQEYRSQEEYRCRDCGGVEET
jgi:hypothetical protein